MNQDLRVCEDVNPSGLGPRIETWPIDKLIPYARNPRKNDSAAGQMVSSIKEFGFKIPCLVRGDGEVVDGHLRLKAAKQLGLVEVPVILCDEWTLAQVKAFRLMVNRSVSWADWDEETERLRRCRAQLHEEANRRPRKHDNLRRYSRGLV